jgi:hypothetical protein
MVGNSASMVFYPQGDVVDAKTDVLAATTDGNHILGAAYSSGAVTLSDIGVTIPTTVCPGVGASVPQTGGALTPLSTNGTVITPAPLPVNVSATAVNQVVAGSIPQVASSQALPTNIAFITYDGSTPGASLPYYIQGAAGAAGTVKYVTLTGSSAITAPVAGAFSPDNTLFFVSTAGDNQIHYISIPSTAAGVPTDTQQVSPNLPACTPVSAGGNDLGCVFSGTGTVVPATVIYVKPRSTT